MFFEGFWGHLSNFGVLLEEFRGFSWERSECLGGWLLKGFGGHLSGFWGAPCQSLGGTLQEFWLAF